MPRKRKTYPQPAPAPAPAPDPAPTPTPVVALISMGLTIAGPKLLIPGQDSYFMVLGTPDLANWDRIYLPTTSVTLPDGKVIPLSYLFGPSGTAPYQDSSLNIDWMSQGWAGIWAKAAVPVDATPGDYTLEITFGPSSPDLRAAGTNFANQVFEVPVTVQPIPPAVRPSYSVPNFSLWEQKMTQLADKWAAAILDPASGLGQEMFYYDIPRVLYQIGVYLNDPLKYMAAMTASADAYLAYINSSTPHGQVQPWVIFPPGLRIMYDLTRDEKYMDGLLALINSPFVSYNGNPDPNYMRETAYAINWWLEMARLGRPPDAHLYQAVDFLLGQFDMLLVQELGKDGSSPNLTTVPPCQPFFFGLACEALINWYGWSGDNRILPALKLVADYIWKNGVDQSTGTILYDLWKPTGDKFCSLNLLIAPLFAWVYYMSGDATYKQNGDFLFGHFSDEEGIDFSAKVFAQNYRWSFDYLKWRGQ